MNECLAWNRYEGIRNAKSEKQCMQMLRWNGFLTAEKGSESKRSLQMYEACIYGMETLALYRNNIQLETDETNRLMQRMLRDAARAVYCVGLEAAWIVFQYAGGGRIRICRIDPELRADRLLMQKVARSAQAQTERRKRNQSSSGNPMIGADVEFLICSKRGFVIPADRILPRQGKAGADAVYRRDRISYPIAEIRPKPADEFDAAYRNLLEALQLADRRMPREDVIWMAGSMPKKGLPLGGHLHFSQVELDPELIRALDNYLLLPLAMLENEHGQIRRRRYGNPGDVRMKTYGFEYRSLPSWIICPLIAKGVIASAFLIASRYAELTARPLLEPGVAAAFAQGDKVRLRHVCQTLWEDISSIEGYAALKEVLEPFAERTLSGKEWDESKDIRMQWKTQFLLNFFN